MEIDEEKGADAETGAGAEMGVGAEAGVSADAWRGSRAVLLEVGEGLAPGRVEGDAQQLQLSVRHLRRQQPLQRRQREDLHLATPHYNIVIK